MALFKTKNAKELKTTIVGIATAVITVLASVGVIDPVNQPELTTAITSIIGGITSILLIFGFGKKEE
jgi:uncharacterized membrane protein (Fun14 family)